jgi:hypothetical protein
VVGDAGGEDPQPAGRNVMKLRFCAVKLGGRKLMLLLAALATLTTVPAEAAENCSRIEGDLHMTSKNRSTMGGTGLSPVAKRCA